MKLDKKEQEKKSKKEDDKCKETYPSYDGWVERAWCDHIFRNKPKPYKPLYGK
jgi:hypothetical protein